MDASTFAFFVKVVDAGSFASASRQLGIDRSNVSRRIRDIELEVGSALLVRTTRSMRLTEAGAILYERGIAINAQVLEARQAVLSLRAGIRGPLHVSCGPLMLRLGAQKLIWDFCRRYPEVSLRVTLRNAPIDFVRENVDIALRLTKDFSPTVVARELCPIRWDVCASPSYLSKHGVPRTPDDLAKHAWLGFGNGPTLEFVRGKQTWRAKPATQLMFPNHSLVIDAAIEGLGIGLIASRVSGKQRDRFGLQPVLQEFQLLPVRPNRLYAVRPQARYMASQVRCFLDFVIAHFKEAPA